MTTATHSLRNTTSLATIHTTHKIASTLFNLMIPLMSYDEEKMHPQVIFSGSPNQEI
jgi:hypothetical protein